MTKKSTPAKSAEPKPHHRTPRVSNERVIEALRANMGIIARAARALGYSDRCGLWQRIQSDPELQAALADAKECALDMSESALFKQIDEGVTPAIIFHLKCMGKERGYVERQEVKHSGSLAITHEQALAELE